MRLGRFARTASPLILAAASLYCPAALAQTSAPPAAAPSPSAPPALTVYSREVIVDINVTDAKGNPVHGLTRDDFTVLEDGRQVSPRSFREHRSDETTELPAAVEPSLPPNTFTNAGPPESARPLNILLLDSMDTPLANQSMVQKQATSFVEKLAPGTRVAVFGLSATGQLSMLQGFTTDTQLLKAALKSKVLGMQVPNLEDAGQDPNTDAGLNTDLGLDTKKAAQPPPPRLDLNVECNHIAVRGAYTTGAFTQIARYVSGMPGRKNLIWYTGAFPNRMRDRQGDLCADITEQLGEAEGLLDHSHVSVYPIDSRAMDIQAKNDPTSRIVKLQAVEHLSMEGIAEATGGKAIYNTNDLAAAAAQALDAGSNYYTITYTPPNQIEDTRRRTISVKIDRPDVNLTYNHGYHALPPNTALRTGKPIDRATPMQTAMMRGALQPSEILFHVNVAPAAATETSLPPGNTPDPKAMKPPYRRLSLSYLIDLGEIQFDASPDGNYHGQFEYAVCVYDPHDGKMLNSSEMAARPALPPAVYQSMLANGVKVHQEIDVPAKGDYVLRIGVHDPTTDRVGAVEIPMSSIRP